MRLFTSRQGRLARKPFYRKGQWAARATIAQSVEQPPCKRQVGSSISLVASLAGMNRTQEEDISEIGQVVGPRVVDVSATPTFNRAGPFRALNVPWLRTITR